MVSMQKKSINKLSKIAVPIKSKGRYYIEKKTLLRNDFQRDRDRIIHSTAFRRLKHKTQVFVNTTGDHFRTRITHSLEAVFGGPICLEAQEFDIVFGAGFGRLRAGR